MREFVTRRRIEFVDTDMGGIVHFSRFFVFMETAEHLWFEALGTSVAIDEGRRRIGWPRVSAACEYLSPARFGDTLQIKVTLQRKGRTSMTWDIRFYRDEELLARGRVTSVCCVLDPPRRPEPIPIPSQIADQFEPTPDSEVP